MERLLMQNVQQIYHARQLLHEGLQQFKVLTQLLAKQAGMQDAAQQLDDIANALIARLEQAMDLFRQDVKDFIEEWLSNDDTPTIN